MVFKNIFYYSVDGEMEVDVSISSFLKGSIADVLLA